MDQGASLVDKALESGELFELDGWKHIAPAATSGTLHLIGLLSDGGVHSRYDQLKLLFDGVSPWAQTLLCIMQIHEQCQGRINCVCFQYTTVLMQKEED